MKFTSILQTIAILAPISKTFGFSSFQPQRAPVHVVRMGMFDGFLGGGQKKDDWKEKEWREQQEILRKRRENLGFLSEEDEEAIRERRLKANAESKALKSIQTADGGDPLEEWKRLRDEGVISTATKGMERDEGSRRLGSEGLLSERTDEKLPYIDSGYVAEDADIMGGIAKAFRFGKKE